MLETLALLVLTAAAAIPADAVITRVEVGDEMIRPDRKMCNFASGERWVDLILEEFLHEAEKMEVPIALPGPAGSEAAPPPKAGASTPELHLRIVVESCTAEVIDRSTAKAAPNSIDVRLQTRLEIREAGAKEPVSTDVVAAAVKTERMGRLSQYMYGRAFVATSQALAPLIVERVRQRLDPPEPEKEPETRFVPYRPRP